MRNKWLCLFAVLSVLATLCVGCGKPIGNKEDGSKQSAKDDTATIAEVEELATTLANAVMVYDLNTITQYSVLDTATCESIHKDMLNYTEDGKIDWDGEICDTYADFVTIYDAHMSREFETLTLTVTDTKLYDDTAVLADAAAIELYMRDEMDTGDRAIYEAAFSALKIDRVAVVTFDVTFQDVASTEPGGTTETYEEQSGTITVYLVEIGGVWKSYSPTLAGVFPPLAHFPRYLKTNES